MNKIHVLIRLWPQRLGYCWSVPVLGITGRPYATVVGVAGNMETAIKTALAEAQLQYGASLGDVDFQLRNSGL